MITQTQESKIIRTRPLTYRVCKRAFDIVSSLLGLAVLSPFLLVVALLIKLDSRGPIIFTQKRLGLNGKLFTIYKLRTMMQGAREIRNVDGSQFVGTNDPRLTRLGKTLRDYSIDELPQLVNILKGDMSVVGPRPDVPGPSILDDEVHVRIRTVPPGLASLASVHGRNSIPWPERTKWELQYVERASLKLDFEIIWKTIQVVVRREGIYNSVNSTSPRIGSKLG